MRFVAVVNVLSRVLLLFAATAGPELLCPDRRQNVLALVFTRPVTRADYLLAKLAALLAVMGLIAILPLLVLFLGNTLLAFSHDTTFTGVGGVGIRALGASALDNFQAAAPAFPLALGKSVSRLQTSAQARATLPSVPASAIARAR